MKHRVMKPVLNTSVVDIEATGVEIRVDVVHWVHPPFSFYGRWPFWRDWAIGHNQWW